MSRTYTLLISLCLLAGCQDVASRSGATVEPATSSTAGAFPVEVRDFLGRRVQVPQRPERIISLSPRNTELLFAIGAGDRIVGVTTYCNYPPLATGRAKVGGFAASSLSVETIVSLQPDLVIAADAIQRPVIDDLERLGFPVVSLDAESLPVLFEEIALLGQVTQCSPAAEQLIRNMRGRVEHFKSEVAMIPPEDRVTVYFEIWDQPLTVAGPSSFIGELIELAGGVNMLDDPQARYVPISEEVVLHADPEVILLPSDSASAGRVHERRGWSQLQAVRNERVHRVNSDLIARCGPRLIEALEEMAAALYPTRFQPTPSTAEVSGL